MKWLVLTIGGALLALATTGSAQAGTAQRVDGLAPVENPRVAASPHDGEDASGHGPSALSDANVFPARRFGSCIWDVSHDVGPCVAKAYAAAAAAGGGLVILPGGAFGLATPLASNASGVSLLGMGVGDPRESFAPNQFQAVTRLVWIGTDGATMFAEGPASDAGTSLSSANVQGVVFDCNGKAAICAKFAQTSHSTIEIGVSEPRSIGAYLTTTTTADSPGTQDNDIKIDARSTSTTDAPTGILIDGAQGSNWNVSYNRIWKLFSWYRNGDGIVFGDSDNNLVFDLRTYRHPGGNGSAVIFAAPGYTSPNGVSTSTSTATNPALGEPPYTTRVLHTGSMVTVQGLAAGAKIVAGKNNAGTAAYAPQTFTTTAEVARGSPGLPFSAASGIAAGLALRCDTGSGVVDDDVVVSATKQAVHLSYRTLGIVARGTLCRAGMGIAETATPGTYEIVFTSPHVATILPPKRASPENDVVLSDGILRARDLTIPFSGQPVGGDRFLVTVHKAPSDIALEAVDAANAIPAPYFAPGATGSYQFSSTPFPVQADGRAGIDLHFAPELCGGHAPTIGALAANLGGCSSRGPTGKYSSNTGGVENAAPGYAATTVGGHQNTASGTDSLAAGEGSLASAKGAFALGEVNAADGAFSWARGAHATARRRYGWNGFASGDFKTPGDAQYGTSVLRGSAKTSRFTLVTIHLTTDGKAAGTTNISNIPDRLHYHMQVSAACSDHDSDSSIWASWDPAGADLSRRGAILEYVGAYSSALAPSRSAGLLGKATLQISADATYAGVTIAVTLPRWTSEDLVDCVATLTSLQEVQ